MSHQKKILITGGLGFIGSHTVVELIAAGYTTVIVDDLSNAELFILDRVEKITGTRPAFFQEDVTDPQALTTIFRREKGFDAVIHFAAFKSVGESVEHPLKYYRNNLCGLINLLEVMRAFSCNKLVFSSSATVYGQPDQLPADEQAPFKKALSAYGSTKQMGEDILEKVCAAGPLHAISLRYFNPVGAHPSGLLGELPKGVPNNLMPFITQVCAGVREKLMVFGKDYNTPDGTCVRDYIHVKDLAEAHVKSCDRLLGDTSSPGYEVFNIATGNGISVREMIRAFEQYNEIKVNYEFGPRRAGDAAAVYADPGLANRLLDWKARSGLKEMVMSAWKWQQLITKNYLSNEAGVN